MPVVGGKEIQGKRLKIFVGRTKQIRSFRMTPRKLLSFVFVFACIGGLLGAALLLISNAAGYPKGPGGTYSDWYFPDNGAGYDSLDWDITPEILPVRPNAAWVSTHFYFMNFSFINGSGGYTGLQDYSEPTRLRPISGKTITFSIWDTQLGGQSPDQSQPFYGEGTGWQTRLAYTFEAGKTYHMRIAVGPNGRDSTGTWWGVTITDKSTGTNQLVGQIKVPPTWGKLKPSAALNGEDANWNQTGSGQVTEYDCSKFITSTTSVDNLVANGAVRPNRLSNMVSTGISQPDGGFIKVATEPCPASSTTINSATMAVRHVLNLGGTLQPPLIACNTNLPGAYLYQLANYQGSCSRFTVSNARINDSAVGDDAASSIKIVGNYRATLYRDISLSGVGSVFTADDPDLSNDAIGDNQTSSVQIEELTVSPPQTSVCDTSAPGAYLFQLTNYQGSCSRIVADGSSASVLSIGDNSASSIKITGSYKVILYQDTNFGGTSSVFVSDDPDLGNDAVGDNQVSSFKISAVVTSPPTTADTTPPTISYLVPTNGATVANSFTVSVSANDNVGVTKYEHYLDGVLIKSAATFLFDTAPYPNGTHTMTVMAYDAAGNVGKSSVTITIKNVDTVRPQPPAGLTTTSVTSGKVSLSWTAAKDNVGIAGYWIVRNDVTIAKVGSVTTFDDATVVPNTKYGYYLLAIDPSNNVSDPSNFAYASIPAVSDAQAPSTPTNLVAVAVSSSQINLSWLASTDNIGVTAYDVYRSTAGSQATKIAATPYTSFGDGSLTGGTQYTYYVVARDASGNSSQSSNQAVTATQPPQPTTQFGTIGGKITNGKSNVPLSGAKITIRVGGTNKTFSTNSIGAYSTSSLPVGTYPVKYSKGGFVTQIINVTVINNATSSQDVVLLKK